jgi:hypothetical protein
MLQAGYIKIFVYVMFLATAVSSLGAGRDPYSTLTAEQKAVLEPVVERYIRDQIRQDWADLWEIQDQTSDLKNELLLGRRNAPDLNKEQFVSAMRDTIGTGYPRLRSFELREVKPDKGDFILIGCGKATRESWKQTGFVIAGIRLADGKPKVDLWSMTSDSCP